MSQAGPTLPELDHLELSYYPNAFRLHAEGWLATLHNQLQWRSESYRYFGKTVAAPRRIAWYGDADAHYRYSGQAHAPLPWTPLLGEIRDAVAVLSQTRFNSVLGNLYRDGQDSMGWHADDEAELGAAPLIASLSLGAGRRIRFRHRKRRGLTYHLDLDPGSLLIMQGNTQRYWQHQVPKTTRSLGPRINLTFRTILARPSAH